MHPLPLLRFRAQPRKQGHLLELTMYTDVLSTQHPPSSLQPGLDCSRTCKGRPRVHINPPSCSRSRRWGQEAVCISWPSSAHRRTTAGQRGGPVPILKIVFP